MCFNLFIFNIFVVRVHSNEMHWKKLVWKDFLRYFNLFHLELIWINYVGRGGWAVYVTTPQYGSSAIWIQCLEAIKIFQFPALKNLWSLHTPAKPEKLHARARFLERTNTHRIRNMCTEFFCIDFYKNRDVGLSTSDTRELKSDNSTTIVHTLSLSKGVVDISVCLDFKRGMRKEGEEDLFILYNINRCCEKLKQYEKMNKIKKTVGKMVQH